MSKVIDSVSGFQSELQSLARVLNLIKLPQEPGYEKLKLGSENNKLIKLRPMNKKEELVNIKNLTVSYTKDSHPIFEGINLTLKRNDKVCLIGRTGCGKSTLFKAICGYFEEYKGEINIKGKELKGYNVRELRKSMSIILQEAFIFKGKLRENLDPKDNLDDLEIINALKQVKIWQKFEELELLDTKIDQNSLSHGEKQLLGLARVILSKRELVLLDESTSNIDNKTEQLIWNIVRDQFKNSSVFAILHGLHNIDFFNRYLPNLIFIIEF